MDSGGIEATVGRDGPWPVLDVHERRMLGVLVEKAKTTPDAYPLSVNALVTGSNQKSNREPLLNLSDFEVEDALTRCKEKGLAVKITGGRVIRWRHQLYESWHVDKLDLAILAELLLRGPQTEGELRARASRMEPFEDLEALRRNLKPLVERKLVVYLTPEDRRGAILTHGFHDPRELNHLRTQSVAQVSQLEANAIASPAAPASAASREWETELAALRSAHTDLCAEVAKLREQVDGLRQARGV